MPGTGGARIQIMQPVPPKYENLGTLGQHRAMRALTGGRRGDMNYLSLGSFGPLVSRGC